MNPERTAVRPYDPVPGRGARLCVLPKCGTIKWRWYYSPTKRRDHTAVTDKEAYP